MKQTETIKWVRLGDYIELCDERNGDGLYTVDDVMGMTITKEIIPTKAKIQDNDLSKFWVVKPHEFVYNPRTHGKKIGLGYNTMEYPFIISWNNIAFRVKDTSRLLPDYLYMNICREEWDRAACYRSWGSSTEVFAWDTLCDIEIPLPPIEVQQELVDTYNGLKSLAEQNEALIEPLSKACEAFIVDCQTKYPLGSLGKNISVFDCKNKEGKPFLFYGINKEKTFIPTVADTNNLDNTKYKVVRKGVFVFNGMHVGRDVAICIAIYDKEQPIIVSPAYTTFVVKNESNLLPEFLFLQLSRAEFGRRGWFFCDSSVRGGLDWDRFCEIEIPLPPIEVQQSIVNIYHCMKEAKSIAAEAREKLKTLCPALIQRAANL